LGGTAALGGAAAAVAEGRGLSALLNGRGAGLLDANSKVLVALRCRVYVAFFVIVVVI
jgi:hypothetical protein